MEDFREALTGRKIPLLVLDEKWHHLFSGIGKTPKVVSCEKAVDELLKKQGRLTEEHKELKNLKNKLMKEIVSNMDQKQDLDKREHAIDDNKRLIDEINLKMDEVEDEQLDIPRQLDEANRELMIVSMDVCYRVLSDNGKQIEEIGNWIKEIRKQLKENIIRKQFAEYKNVEIYNYMHAILGAKVINVFDMKFDEDGEVINQDKLEKEEEKGENIGNRNTDENM